MQGFFIVKFCHMVIKKKKRLQIVQNIILEKNSIKICNILKKEKVKIA